MTSPPPPPGEMKRNDTFSRRSLAVFVLALVSLLATMGYSWSVVRHLAKLTEKVIQPALELQNEATLTHLWTEETITGDPEFSAEALDRRYAALDFDIDRVVAALHDPRIHLWFKGENDLVQRLAGIKAKNFISREIAARRLAAPDLAQPGSVSDQQQDDAFNDLCEELSSFTETMSGNFAAHYHRVYAILVAMLSFTLVFGVWVGIILVRYQTRRRADLQLLYERNLHLLAFNQQLTATEQQLRATNQQLMATEQQLRASNQQLTATDQQLRLNNATLEANHKVLEEKERRYRNLIDNMAEGVAIHQIEFDREHIPVNYRILEVNAQYEDILGLRREEVVGRLATEAYGGDEPPYLAEYAKVALGGAPQRFDTDFAQLNRYFSISVSSFEHGLFVTVFSDITERKQAEAALRLNEERLESLLAITQHRALAPKQLYDEAMAKALQLTGSIRGMLYLVEPGSGLLRVETIVDQQGLKKGYGPSSADEDCALVSSDFHHLVRDKRTAVVTAITGGEEAAGTRNGLDGCNIQVMGIPFLLNGAVTSVVVLAGKDSAYTDADLRQATLLMDAVLRIAELRRADDEKHRLSVRMQKLESLGVLAGGIAHDFNNMLAGILGNVNLAGMLVDSRSELQACLDEAEKAAQRAKGLTQQLLAFAKGGVPVRKVTALPELIIETATFAARGSHARCVFALADDLRSAEIDPGQIGQVINNLVLNAIQAVPVDGCIHISADNIDVDGSGVLPVVAGQYIRLVFRDQGIGIAPQHLDRIFDPYFTTKDYGNGLGLAASHAIVTNHQGAILVTSAPGEGTEFTILLPAAQTLPEKGRVGLPQPWGGGGKILVMDDELSLRTLLARILDISGFEAVVTADGGEAVETYRQAFCAGAGFDAVILDLTVAGGMGGREALERIREIDPEVVAIVSSGYSKDPVMANYRDYGFLGVISKPYTADELRAELRRVFPGQ